MNVPRAQCQPCAPQIAGVCVLVVLHFGVSVETAFAADDMPKRVDAPAYEIQVQKVRPNLQVLSGAGGNIVVWSGADGTVLVDSGLSAASATVFEAVARVAPGRIRFVVNTNGHPDHTGGNEYAASKGAVVIGHESLRHQTARPAGAPALKNPAGTLPLVTLNDAIALHLNGDRLDIIHVADAHTRGDVVLRWAEADVVDLGDIYWNGQYPFIDVAAGGSLAGTVAAIEAALARSTERTTYIPGHGVISSRADLVAYRDMLVAVGRRVREAIEQGQGLDEILAARPTAEFDGRFGQGALVTPQEFVRAVHRDLTEPRSGR